MLDFQHPDVERAVRAALEEDIGAGDATTRACVAEAAVADGAFRAREPMVLAGVELLPVIYGMRGGIESLVIEAKSGDRLQSGQCVARVRGRAWTLLECERVSLNFLQRLSGVATLAGQYADRVKHTKCRILDTRKTTPGLRVLEKLAVAAGGALNHRIGLYDAVLIKNNHITAAGGVRQALARVADCRLPVEIEVRTIDELDEALDCGASRLLLDNRTPAEAREWIARVNGRAVCELSGGITLDTVQAYAESGADYISCGAITHSARAVDLNFRIRMEP